MKANRIAISRQICWKKRPRFSWLEIQFAHSNRVTWWQLATTYLLVVCLFWSQWTFAGEWLWQHPAPQGNTIRAVASGQNFLIAVGDYGSMVRFQFQTKIWQSLASPTQNHLRAIARLSETDWVATGFSGTILRSSDSGHSWTLESSGTQANLYGLAFGSSSVGMAVGSNGTVLFTQDGGHSWSPLHTGVKSTLRAINFLNPNEAVVVGESGVILKTNDAGMKWEKQQVGGNLYAIDSRENDLVAVGGEPGYFWNKRVIYSSSDRGKTWKPEVNESGSILYGVSIAPNMAMIACGESGTLLQTGGKNSPWTKVKCPVNQLLAALLRRPDTVMAFGSFGILVTSRDGGKSWEENFKEKQKEFYAISFFDANHGVAVGEEGRILFTVNGGVTWQTSNSNFSSHLFGVAMLNSRSAVAVGGEGLTLRTTDGGGPGSPLSLEQMSTCMKFQPFKAQIRKLEGLPGET